ncbi:hypothetical protein KY285_022080 [Solanum tuberosum]|nr:hypothetical protein KY285_022080 [Solanum tuberosum]
MTGHLLEYYMYIYMTSLICPRKVAIRERTPLKKKGDIIEWSVKAENHSNGGGAGGLAHFPSLAVASTTKTKKKKPQTLFLQGFNTYSVAKQSQTAATVATKGLTPEEVLMLPTSPRERTVEELGQSRLGGGFRSYGYDRQGGRGLSDDSHRQGGLRRDTDREIAPSRADETDDWGVAKKTSAANKAFVPSSGQRFDRTGSFESKVVIPIRIGEPKGRKRKVDGDLPPVVVHSTV